MGLVLRITNTISTRLKVGTFYQAIATVQMERMNVWGRCHAAGVNHSGEHFDKTYCDKIIHQLINRNEITSPGLLFSFYDVENKILKLGVTV